MGEISLVVLQVITLTIMLAGLVSLLTALLPGLVIIWVGALIYGLVTGFNWVSGILFGFITVLMLLGNITDNIMMSAGARQKGASWLSIGVALLAAVAGTVLLPPFGGLIFALVGVFLVELIRLKELKKAWESLKGLAGGCGWSVFLRFIIGIIMICWWLVWAFVLPYVSGWIHA